MKKNSGNPYLYEMALAYNGNLYSSEIPEEDGYPDVVYYAVECLVEYMVSYDGVLTEC